MPKSSSRRSKHTSTRASTLSSRPEAETEPESTKQQNDQSGLNLPTEMRNEITELVKTVVKESLKEATTELTKQLLANNVGGNSISGNSISPISSANQNDNATALPGHEPSFQRISTEYAAMGSQMPFQIAPADGGFTPEIPASYITSIQSGEFFYLSKLLPENLHGFTASLDSQSFHLAVGENSTLKLSSNYAPKKKIRDIQSWTTAFTTYMKLIIEKFPGRAKDLIAYLDLIRYAASYHHSLGWLLYDHKFRLKAANDKSISWGQLDMHLWMRIFTVNQAKLLADHSLFFNGPSSNNESGITAARDGKCGNFNRGRKCAYTPCRYRHVCNQPGCEGPHPSFQCPLRAGVSFPNNIPAMPGSALPTNPLFSSKPQTHASATPPYLSSANRQQQQPPQQQQHHRGK